MRSMFLLQHEDADYDEFTGHVVMAISETDARRAAFNASGSVFKRRDGSTYDSRELKWLNGDLTSCVKIVPNPRARKAQVILSSFRAG